MVRPGANESDSKVLDAYFASNSVTDSNTLYCLCDRSEISNGITNGDDKKVDTEG
jgi:hypothetical protein